MDHHAGLGPAFPWGAMLVLAAVVLGAPTLCITVAVAWRTRGSRGQPTEPTEPTDGAGAARRHADRAWPVPEGYRHRTRVGRLAGTAVGAVAGASLVVSSRAYLAPMACVGGYLLGVLAGVLWASAPPQGTLRQASLDRRRPLDFAPTWAALAAAGAALPVVAAPAIFAVAPRVSYGPWRPDRYAPSVVLPGGHLAWPGPSSTVSLAVVAVTALAVAALGSRRVADAPPLAGLGDPDADLWWRRSAGRAAVGAALGVVALCLASVLVLASSGLAVVGDPASAAYFASRVVVWAGIAVALGGLAGWLVLDGPRLTSPTDLASPGAAASPAG